jgi:periplasmic protein TonB
MAYVDQKMSQGRIWAIVVVALLHALFGYALVTGLAYKAVKQIQQDLKTFDVLEEPPPPEEEPPPPQEVKQVQPPPVVSPPPIVRTQTPPPPVTTVRDAPPSPPITYTAPPAPPAPVAPPPPPPPPPAPPRVVQAASAKGSLQGLIRPDDYPAAAQRNDEQGTVRVRLTVGTNGRVTDCTVVGSSGSRSLDDATCRILRSRASFTPARDNNGNPISDTVNAPPITWRLEG